MFTSDHPFEIYDSQYKNMFWFEKIYTVKLIIDFLHNQVPKVI